MTPRSRRGNFEHVFDAAGGPACADDMSPLVRAFALLLEHANRQKGAQLPPCGCGECERVRGRLRVARTEEPGELCITFAPVGTP
jgi:hypothetical protein